MAFRSGSVPRGNYRPDYTWIWPANTLLLGTKPPFTNYDWPNPIPPPPPIIQNTVRVLVQPVTPPAVMPFVQSDWPLSQTYPYVNYNYTEGLNVANLGSILNPFSYEWNATPDVQPIDQTWIQSLVNTILRPPPPPPFKQTDHPLPRSIFLPIDQFYSNSTNLLPVANITKPFAQYDWPVPIGNPRLDQFIGSQIVILFPEPPPTPVPVSQGGGKTHKHSHLAPYINEIRQFASKGGSANKTTAVSSRSSSTGRKK